MNYQCLQNFNLNNFNVFNVLKLQIWDSFTKTFPQISNNLNDKFNVDYPKEANRGDITTNIAMVFAKNLQLSPKQVFDKLVLQLKTLDFITDISFINPGFININIKPDFFALAFSKIINSSNYGFENIGNGQSINVEFASPNPTGPVHIGHVRGAIYGDVISNLLAKSGYKVTREYYVNDSGEQIKKVAKSLYIRYMQVLGQKIELEEDCYPGEYLIDIAKLMVAKLGEDLKYDTHYQIIRDFGLTNLLNNIKQSLANIGVKHDVYTSETDILNQGYIQNAIEILTKSGYIYQGTLPKPKGKASTDWEEAEQTLFKSTLFGDDEDRVVKKSNGLNTYFSGDIGYHLHKIQRGFDKLIIALGADHLGYVKRIKAVVESLAKSQNKQISMDVKLCQLVKFLKNGQPMKMSKRKGVFETLDDVLDEVEKNIIRFIMVSKKNDIGLDFDLEKVKQTTKENEIFYIQYSYSRASSVLAGIDETALQNQNIDIKSISNPQDVEFIKKVLEFPKIIQIALNSLEPHHITYYLYNLAGEFHKLWHIGNEDPSKRFIVNKQNSNVGVNSRLLLPFMLKNIINESFKIIGVDAMEKM